jgi:carbohydrate-selective porin OprB
MGSGLAVQKQLTRAVTYLDRRLFLRAMVALCIVSCGRPLWAQNGAEKYGITQPSIATSLPNYGDPSDTRKWLYDRGVSYNLIYTNDVLGNMSGGLRRGTIDQGKLEAQLLIDLDKLAGWKDWTFYANAFGIYNSGRIRRNYVGGMNTIAAIEADPTVRLSELWLERWVGRSASDLASSLPTRNSSTAISVSCSCRATGPRSRQSICRGEAPRIRCRRRVCG